MKPLVLILFLVLLPNTLAQGFGVSPSEIDSQTCGSFYVINPSNHKILIEAITPEKLTINKKSFPLYPEQRTMVEVCSDEKINTNIELTTKNQFSSSINIPVKLNPSKDENLKINNKKIEGIIGVIAINIIGLTLLFSTKWMKKHS